MVVLGFALCDLKIDNLLLVGSQAVMVVIDLLCVCFQHFVKTKGGILPF